MLDVNIMLYIPNANCANPSEKIVPWYAKCQGSLNVHKIVTTSFKLCTPEKTLMVERIIRVNIVIKNKRNPYRNHTDDKNRGGFFLWESFNLFPSKSNNCPRPQYRLQKTFSPPNSARQSGIKNSIIPSHANKILNSPSAR